MSRRRPWPLRHKGQAFLLGLTAIGAARQWPTAAAAIAVGGTAVAGAWWWARSAVRARTGTTRHAFRGGQLDMRPCGVYQHFFTNGAHVYIGQTNHYRARTQQHIDGSWWTAYVDWPRSLWQEWTAKDCPPGVTPTDLALAEEARLIALHAPIGNKVHNPLYWQQEWERARLKAAIAWVDPTPAAPARRLRYRSRWSAA